MHYAIHRNTRIKDELQFHHVNAARTLSDQNHRKRYPELVETKLLLF